MPPRVLTFLLSLLLLLPTVPTAAQFVAGEWVQRTDANIRKYRTTPVEFLALDADGRVSPGVTVRLQQTRHAFTLGVAASSADFNLPGDQPLFRCFNTVSLRRLTDWRSLSPKAPAGSDTQDRQALVELISGLEKENRDILWGPLVSAEPLHLPEWAVPLPADAFAAAVRAHGRSVAKVDAYEVSGIDLAGGLLDHERISPALLRLLHAEFRAAAPETPLRLRFDQAWVGPRSFDVIRRIDELLAEQLPIDGLSLGVVFPAQGLVQDQIEADLRRLTRFGKPLMIDGLEVAGSSPLETSINLETVIRTAFAEPLVQGLIFDGLTADNYREPSAELIDEAGELTGAGRVIDRLFRDVWWSDLALTADELGRTRGRVFLGRYEVTVTWPDGHSQSLPLRLDQRRDHPPPLILQRLPAASED
jgi:hypothetical protein